MHVTIEPGTKLDRYELLCLLARGGMANVWLARLAGKHGFEKLLAIKTILTNEAENASFKDMFLDEARLASRIDHPSVVRVTDVGEHFGVPYLVMELVEGEPLYNLVQTAAKNGVSVPVGVALRIVTDACRGLQAAHELTDAAGASLNVVHRDMSPQNILITTAGIAKIIDFGIAQARDRSADATTNGTLKGKISYMPREQALGKPVDARADTWALGAVLYYILSGRPPYKAETQLATLKLAMSGAPIDPLPSTVPALVRSFVNKALAQDLTLRFQTAAEMGEALDHLIRRLGTATTHAQTGAFLKSVVHERIEARKRLVREALSDAAHRESSAVDIVIPSGLETSDGSFDESGSGSAANQRNSYSIAGTFAASAFPTPRVPRWHSIGIVVLAVMGAIGILLLGAVLMNAPSAKRAPNEGATAKTVAAGGGARAGSSTSARAAGSVAGGRTAPSPPATGVTSAAADPPRTSASSTSTSTGATTRTPPSLAGHPARPVPTQARQPSTPKRDDEAGF